MKDMKWLEIGESEMKAHLEEIFPEYLVEKEGGNWLSFKLTKLWPAFEMQAIYAYTYSEKKWSEDMPRKWYFSFFNMWWRESKEVAITEGMTLYFKEQYEELMRLEHLTKQATSKILDINKDESGLRDWKLEKLID